MAPQKSPRQESMEAVARMAGVEKTFPFRYLNIIGTFAKNFGQHPDEIYCNTFANTVMGFTVAWKEEAEFQERFRYFEEQINKGGQPIDTD